MANAMSPGRMRGWVDFIAGIPVATKFKDVVQFLSTVRANTSVRVGSGAATLAALDGGDGRVMADGAAAGFFSRDRADSTKWFAWYRNGTIRLANEAGDLLMFDGTTALLTLPSFTTLTYAGTWATLAGYPALSYRQLPALGLVQLRGGVTTGATTTICSAGIPAALRPGSSHFVPIPCNYFNGTTWSNTPVYVDASGNIVSPALAGVPAGGVIAINGYYSIDW